MTLLLLAGGRVPPLAPCTNEPAPDRLLASGRVVPEQQVGVQDVGRSALDRAVDPPLGADVVPLVGEVHAAHAALRGDRRTGPGAVADDARRLALRAGCERPFDGDPLVPQWCEIGGRDAGRSRVGVRAGVEPLLAAAP